MPLERALHRERINDRRQHAHVVGLGALHAGGGAREAAKDIAAADHQADLHAKSMHGPGSRAAMRSTMPPSRP